MPFGAKRSIDELARPEDVPGIKAKLEEMMNFIFTRSQENLANPMPWGESKRPGGKREDTTIWDNGFLAGSCSGPFWEGDTIKLVYDAPYAVFVEFGTEPHPVSHKHFIAWAKGKLGVPEEEAVSVSYAIAQTIMKYGTDPHPFLRPAINDAIVKYNLKVKPL
jgi:hypothetical protein